MRRRPRRHPIARHVQHETLELVLKILLFPILLPLWLLRGCLGI